MSGWYDPSSLVPRPPPLPIIQNAGHFPGTVGKRVGDSSLRRSRISLLTTLQFLACVAGPVGAQTLRTVRVAAIGHVGTPRTLSVATEGAWRLIDLDDHRLVGEGAGPGEWQFRVSRGGRVSMQEEAPLTSASGTGTPATARGAMEAVGFRLEGAAPDQRFTVRVGRRTLVYPGAVELWPAGHSGTGLRLINEAPVEQYLLGVVTGEGSPSFHPEALKALAVAARSYVEHNRGRHGPEAEMCDTVHCQVYPGVGQVSEKVARAVADTAGIVALSGGAVIDAVFSADCGGQTRNSEDVWPGWGKIPYLRSVEDRPPNGGPDYCSVSRNHIAHLILTAEQVGRLLGLRELTRAKLTLARVERDSSGRVAALQLALGESVGRSTLGGSVPGDALAAGDEPLPCELWGGKGAAVPVGPAPTVEETRAITLAQLRRSFGDQLRGRLAGGALFPDGSLELECRGLGHGVGLCQWGAQGMALPPYNHTFDEILRHYYSGITLGPAPLRIGRLALQLRDDGGEPLAGVSVRLLPAGPAGSTDAQGQWTAGVPEGTYQVELRRGSTATTFFAVRVGAGKNPETRLALVWRDRGARVARRWAGPSSGG
jgi:stage II sporulation protein D